MEKDLNFNVSNPINNSNQQSMVDLHGLSVERARARVNWHLNVSEQTHTQFIRFVTGRGNHINSKGERGTLHREFTNWLSEENLRKITAIKKYDGYYEVDIQPSQKHSFETLVEHIGQNWLKSNKDSIKHQAENGDAYYEYLLGRCYEYGIGYETDYKQAVIWYEKAANKKNIYAIYALAGCYWQGKGIRQNDAKAIQLFKEAAALNSPWAVHQLGDIYCYGDGVKADSVLAFKYYQQAADLGIDIAKRKLAHFYFYGKAPVEKDEQKGFQLYKEVADNGDAHAAYNVACSYLNGNGVTTNTELAFNYAKQAADKNDPDAQFLLSLLYEQGLGTKQDLALSLKYLHQSANNNFNHALFKLALNPDLELKQRNSYMLKAAQAGQIIAQAMVLLQMYSSEASTSDELKIIAQNFWKQSDENFFDIAATDFKFLVIDTYIEISESTKKQTAKIIRLLETLTKEQYPQAFFRLGCLHMAGKFVKRDLAKAEKLLLEGAKLNHRGCWCSLGYLYEEKSDFAKAFECYQKAAYLNDANSYSQLGLLYRQGKGVKQDLDQAILCFYKAMELDSGDQKHKQYDGLQYTPVFPHAAFNIGSLFWHGDAKLKILPNQQTAIAWFILAADHGHKDANNVLQRLNINNTDTLYQKIVTSGFWKPAAIKENQPNTDPKAEMKHQLDELASILNIKVEWHVSNDRNAWCYIDTRDIAKLTNISLAPFILRKTKDGKQILMAEKITLQSIIDCITLISKPSTVSLNL